MMVLSLVLLALFQLTIAHNWLHSPSRAPIASTVAPCLPRRSDLPHVQVGPNQHFQIEWKVGHGFFAYFVILHEKDQEHMKELSTGMLDQYINEAPSGSDTPPPKTFWKFHRKGKKTDGTCDLSNNGNSNFFARSIDSNDPMHIPRDVTFGGNACQLEFQAKDMAKDRRVSYVNDKWPWIEAVHRYNQEAEQATLQDTANFVIPGRGGAGRYIVNYFWRGYRDCVDVDYNVERQITNIYGVVSEESSYERIDHCFFEDHVKHYLSGHCTEVVAGSMADCFAACGPKGSFHCRGVQVAPVVMPDTVAPEFRDVELLPWGASRPKHSGTTDTWRCEKDKFKNAPPNTYACVGVYPRDSSETFDVYATTNDPRDPYFYSTCYVVKLKVVFDSLPPPSKTRAVGWRHAGLCTPCNVTAANSYVAAYPQWTAVPEGEACINCDAEPVTAVEPPPFDTAGLNPPHPNKWKHIGDGKACAGLGWDNTARTVTYNPSSQNTCGGGETCFKLLQPIAGSRAVSSEMCEYLATHDPECSKDVMFVSSIYFRHCVCKKSKACCGECDARSVSTLSLKQLV